MKNEFLNKKVVKVAFNPSGVTAQRTVAAHGLGVIIPSGAIITNAYYQVITTLTDGASDTATIALMVEGAGDLKAAMAISDATNVWDAGVHGLLPGSYAERVVSGDTAVLDTASKAGSYILTTADREVTATIAIAALTVGLVYIYIEYVY